MSKTLRTVAVIAGAVALIATGVGAVAGSAALAATASTVATYASITATVASVGAQITAPKPIARGSPAQVVIDIEPPRPYIVGEVMTGGVMRYDNAYGPTLKKVPNPYRWQVRVMSGVGPISGWLGDYFDFQPISAYYSGSFLSIVRQLGNRPEASALLPPIVGTGASTAPGWGVASKLSGCAAVGLNLRFDKDSERYASGIPIYTALLQGEKVYDPRQDSTYPGGSGACRAGVESTYVYSRNPAAHAITYALGRFQNGKRIFGLGQSIDAIDTTAIVDWANTCDLNGWTANLVLTEGGTGANLREQRVRNLDDLCAAGGGRWFQAGGKLSFDWHRPRLSLATLTDDDILEAGGGTDAVRSVRDRMNGVRPQYISPAHNWQQITAAEIIGTTYRTEDGSALTQVYPLNGVTNTTQAGQLASYAMADSRELGPIDLQASAKWRFYRPGDTITIDSSLIAYQGQAVINERSLNPQTLAVSLSLKSETPGKHAFALGKVASPPPTPTLAQTPEERDLLASAALAPRSADVADVVAPANANRVPYSRMEGDRGFAALFNPAGLSGSVGYGANANRRFFVANVTATASGQTFSIGSLAAMRVTELERLSVQAKLDVFSPAAAGGSWVFRAVFRDAGGTASFSTIASGSGEVLAATVSNNFIDVPAGQVSMTLELVAVSGAAGAWTIAISEPMVTSAAPGQTVHPAFSPGPNASDGADPNNLITVSGGNLLGIGTGNGTPVDNTRNLLTGTLSSLPAGEFIGQQTTTIDTKEVVRWGGAAWVPISDVTATINGPADLTLNYDAGLTLTSPLPVTGTYQLVLAGTGPVTSGVTWAVSVDAGTFSGTAPSMVGSGSGQLRINSPMTSPEALLRITATVGGKTYPAFVMKVNRVVAAPATGSVMVPTPLTSISSSSFTRMHGSDISITLPTGVTAVSLTAAGDLTIAPFTPTGATVAEGKWQRETSPGTWVDVGSVGTSAPSPDVYDTGLLDGGGMPVYDANPGSISVTATATGLPAGSVQKFRFMARVSSGNIRNVTGDGTASATA